MVGFGFVRLCSMHADADAEDSIAETTSIIVGHTHIRQTDAPIQ